MKKIILDEEEEQILRDIEAGNFSPHPNMKEEIAKAREAAKNTMERLAKTKAISIRVNIEDLENFKIRAAKEGLPYQTLICSMIHKYTNS